MARFFPPYFPERDFREGEQAVWEALGAQLPGDAAVFYSVRLPDGTREREIDYVVAWPGEGLTVLEVTGGTIGRYDDGGFYSDYHGTVTRLRLNPMEQAWEVLNAEERETLYVGLSRARSQLVVVGDLDEIAAVGGEGVRKRLGAAERWSPST